MTTSTDTPIAAPADTLPEVPAPSSNVTVPVHKPKPPNLGLTAEQRRERARKAGLARAEKAAALNIQVKTDPHGFDWQNAPIPDAERFLAELRAEVNRGAEIIQQRYGHRDLEGVTCVICGTDIAPGKWAMSKTPRDPETGLLKAIYYCTANCVARENLRNQGVRNVPQ